MLPKSLYFNTLSYHGFFKGGSAYGAFDYKLLFEAGDIRPRYVRLPAPALFDVSRHGWSFSEDILDEYLTPAMPRHPSTKGELDDVEPMAPPPFTYTGQPPSFDYEEGSSSQQYQPPHAAWNPHDDYYR